MKLSDYLSDKEINKFAKDLGNEFKSGAYWARHNLESKLKLTEESLLEAVKIIEFYKNGWLQKPSSLKKDGTIEEVWKNPIIQADHGTKAVIWLLEKGFLK